MATITGDSGANTLIGDPTDDLIKGKGGADTIFGGGGADTIFGGAGADIIEFSRLDSGIAGTHVDGNNGIDTLRVIKGTLSGFSNAVYFTDVTFNSIERVEIGDATFGAAGAHFMASAFGSGIASDATFVFDGFAFNSFSNSSIVNITMGDESLLDLSQLQTDVLFEGLTAPSFITTLYIDGSQIWGSNIRDQISILADDVIIDTGDGDDSVISYSRTGALIELGGGDDRVRLNSQSNTVFGGDGDDLFQVRNGVVPDQTMQLDGGDGRDSLFLYPSGSATIDLRDSNLTGFEELLISTVGLSQSAVIRTVLSADLLNTGFSDDFKFNAFYRTNFLDIEMGTAGILDMSAFSFDAEDLTITVDGAETTDFITASTWDDHVLGRDGDDTILGGDGDDDLRGGRGRDVLDGEGGNDQLRGGDGVDVLRGGAGNDTLAGGNGWDKLIGGGGDDMLRGQGQKDRLWGNFGADTLDGGNADDALFGGNGNDTLIGGQGADQMTGGSGFDSFVFLSSDDSLGGVEDVILDLSADDTLDLSGIDGDQATTGDQVLSYIGGAAFSGSAGELRTAVDGSDLMLLADTDGDLNADFALRLSGVTTLDAALIL